MSEKNYGIGPVTFILAMILVVLITAGITYYVANFMVPMPGNETEAPIITVRGDASKTVMPDLLTVGITVETLGANKSEATAENSKQTSALKAALLAAGVSANEIETSSYYTYEVYNESCYRCTPYYAAKAEDGVALASAPSEGIAVPDYYPEPYPCEYDDCEIIGYKTVHSITVTSGKINDSGKIIESVMNVTNASVDYVYFSMKEETRIRVEGELQAAAALNARSKAANIATGLGSSLGRLVSVTTDGYYPYPIYAYEKSAYAGGGAYDSAPPTEIFPTDITMSSSIVAVYELNQ